MSKPQILVVACTVCEETGVLPDNKESNGLAVVCITCNGEGHHDHVYTPFTGIKKRSGIKRVRRSGQGILQGDTAADAGIPYDEFLKGKRP